MPNRAFFYVLDWDRIKLRQSFAVQVVDVVRTEIVLSQLTLKSFFE